jgi:hypothetical protein
VTPSASANSETDRYFFLFQQPFPAMGADDRANQRLVRAWPRVRPVVAAGGGDDHLTATAAFPGHRDVDGDRNPAITFCKLPEFIAVTSLVMV